MTRVLPTPEDIIVHLDRYVRGQHEAKRTLSKAVYFHYLNLVLPEDAGVRLSPEHCLLMGPTGSGKTLLVNTIAKFLDVPVLFVNASSLSGEGYVGESVGDMLARYARFCDYKPHRMNRGILFLDEIDKLHAKESSQADVRGQMVQEELLALLDGNRIVRNKDFGSTTSFDVDTSKILVLATGAFSGIDKIVSARTRGVGFRSEVTPDSFRIKAEDVVRYGFLREFVARFPNLVNLDPLSEDDLIDIMRNPIQSPITSYRRLFDLHGVHLEVTPDGYKELAQRTIAAEQGARGLRQYFTQAVSDVTWRIGSLRDDQIVKIVINQVAARGESAPELVYGKPSTGDSARQFRDLALKGAHSAGGDEKPVHVAESISDLATRAALTSQALLDVTSISDTREWSEEQICNRFEAVKMLIGYSSAQENAKQWWAAFEEQNSTKTALTLRLAEEIAIRRSTIDSFFTAYVYSNEDNIQANLDYLDYHANCRKWGAEAQGAYHVPANSISGIEASDTRRLFSYENGSQRGCLLWQCIEADCLLKSEYLTWLSVLLCKSNIRSVDSLFDWAVIARAFYVPAVTNYKSFVFSRMKAQQHEWICLPDEVRPVSGGLSTKFVGDDETKRRLFLLTRVAEGWLLEILGSSFPKQFAAFAEHPEISERRLTAQFVDSEYSQRKKIHGPSSDSITEELALWQAAASLYPGEHLSLAFSELVIAEIKPLLIDLVRKGSPHDLLDVVNTIQKTFKHLLHSDKIIGLMMLYTKEAEGERWTELIRSLGSEYARLHDLHGRVRSGWRIPPSEEPSVPIG